MTIKKSQLINKGGRIQIDVKSIAVSKFSKPHIQSTRQKNANNKKLFTVKKGVEMSLEERQLTRCTYRDDGLGLQKLSKKTFNSPEEFAYLCDEYFMNQTKKVKEVLTNSGKIIQMKNQRPFTLEGLCNNLGITVATFNKYISHEDYSEYKQIGLLAKQIIAEKIIEGALMRDYDSRIATMYLANRSDLKSEKELAINTSNNKILGDLNINVVSFSSREDAKEYQKLQESNQPITIEAK